MKADFSGYATKNDLLCTDGRTIKGGAFQHQDQKRVPLVWQHQHNEPGNVLGHAILEDRRDGVYAYGFFNSSPSAAEARELIRHGDINALSIHANGLKQQGKNVLHGNIREVSLVLAGANPGAFIDNINISHGDTTVELDDEAVIYTGLEIDTEDDLDHADNKASSENTNSNTSGDTVAENTNSEKTVKDVFDSMTDEQKNVVYFMIGQVLENPEVKTKTKTEGDDNEGNDDEAKHANFDPDTLTHAIEEGFQNMTNVFEQNASAGNAKTQTLSHAQVQAIVNDAQEVGSLKKAVLAHADAYGFDDIDVLFPDAKVLANSPEMLARRTEWVSTVLSGTKHSPFSRIKSVVADITADEARARGYVKGNLKKDEIVKLLKRITEPTTIYKKQKLDRDDVIDITDLDVVAWLKAEMRLMLDEELARAILIGDGRDASSDDKINEERIRPIAKDDEMYAHRVSLSGPESTEEIIELLIRARANYRGSGQPVLFTTMPFLTDMLLVKDKLNRRLYDSMDALASALMVSKIETVEVMEQHPEVVAIFVNLSDYTVGSTRGGEVSMFDDFDIDYNQQKYLIETRVSGALTKPKSAVVLLRPEGEPATPVSPSFDGSTNTITFPRTDGVVYQIDGLPVTGTKTITKNTDVTAVPAEGYSFTPGSTTNWNFVYTSK